MPQISPQQPLHLGRHVVEAEGGDLLILRAAGEIRAEQARLLIQMDREQAQHNGYSLILIDGSKATGFGAGARQTMFDEMKRHAGYLGSTGVFGLSGSLRILMSLVVRAVALLARNFDDEMQIFASEQEARAFIAKRRPERQAEARLRLAAAGR